MDSRIEIQKPAERPQRVRAQVIPVWRPVLGLLAGLRAPGWIGKADRFCYVRISEGAAEDEWWAVTFS